jgi:asparagine synthase (glutamine-hydrolysing)
MRRALREIVPTEILERKRKAFALSGFIAQVDALEKIAKSFFEQSLLEELGFVIRQPLTDAVTEVLVARNLELLGPVLRTFKLELWVRDRLGSHLPHPTLSEDPVPMM